MFGVARPVKEEAASDADFCSSHPMVADGIKLMYGRACTRFGSTSEEYIMEARVSTGVSSACCHSDGDGLRGKRFVCARDMRIGALPQLTL